MGEKTMTLGQAIDKMVEALESLDAGARETAVRAACSHLGVAVEVPSMVTPLSIAPDMLLGDASAPPAAPAAAPTVDICSLKEEKQPPSAVQMACIVAYYLKEVAPIDNRKETVSSSDLETYSKQAGYRLPKKIDQVLIDAKRAGYVESVSRGEYKLNTVGYNLVVHNLPKQKAS